MNQERLMKVILSPHISEKGTILADKNNQIVFKVAVDAQKREIKDAIKLLFNVDVKSVNTVCSNGKRKRFKGILGQRKKWKKAYVTLEAGQDIDFLQSLKEE